MRFKNSFISLLLCCFVIFCTAGICFSSDTTADSDSANYLDDFEDSGDLDDFEDSDALDDFENTTPSDDSNEASVEANSDKPKFYNLSGDVTFSITDNIAHDKPAPGQTDWRDISSLKSELFLELDLKLPASWKIKISGSGFYDAAFSLNDRSDYSDEVIDEDEMGAELRKAYIAGSITDSIDIKTGRQIVVWGKSDNIRVTDVLNPINMKTPGKIDLEDIRLPVFMTKIDYYIGPWNLSGIAVHEKRFNKLPEYGSDFYVYPEILGKIPVNEPSENRENTEFGVSLTGTFSGWDTAFYYADFYDKTPYYILSLIPAPELKLLYSRQTMAGADINIALGNFLLKSEAAYFTSVDFSDNLLSPPIIKTQRPYSMLKSLGGLEFTGFTDTTITLDVMNTHITDYNELAKAANIKRNSWETAIRLDRNYLNEKLSTTLLAMLYGKSFDEGAMIRASCEYDLTDSFTLTGGAVFYDGDEMALLNHVKDNDRVYANFKYSF